jgi:uncharacterized protein (TIGR03083 family)
MDQQAAYKRAYERVVGLVDEGDAEVPVPTCPGWTVKDVVAHLSSMFTRYQSGGPKGFGPGWAEEELEKRAGKSLEECVAELGEHVENPGDIFTSNLGPVAVSDVMAHEQDIRTALGKPGATDDPAMVPSAEMALAWLDKKKEENDELPVMRVVTDDIDHTVGKGEPQATLRTSTFHLFRTLHGRRTPGQVKDMHWEGNPGPWLSHIFIFGPTEEVVER